MTNALNINWSVPDGANVEHVLQAGLSMMDGIQLRWLRKPVGAGMRVPLMGVLRELQNSRLASQLAFMLIDRIRRNAVANYNSRRGEIGWILDDNQGMKAIADTIDSKVNREYAIYEKTL